MNRNKKIVKRAGMALLSGMIALTPAAAVAAPLVAPIVAQAASQTDADWYSDWTYTTNGAVIELTAYNGTETTYEVPATATIDGTTYAVQYGAGGSAVSVGTIANLSFAVGVAFPDNASNLFMNQGSTMNGGALVSLDVSHVDTSNVTNMDSMFFGCDGLKTLNVSKLNTSHVTSMKYMFSSCSGLTSLDVSGFDTSSVTDMQAMFANCSKVTELDVSGWNTSQVATMNGLFTGCTSLTKIDVSKWDTSTATNMSGMFRSCNSLTSLDLSNWDMSNVVYAAEMFNKNGSGYIENLTKIVTPRVQSASATIVLPATFFVVNSSTGLADTSTTGYTTLQSAPTSTTIVTATCKDNGNITTSYDKYLIMRSDATVPNVSFNFTIEPGDAVAADVTNNIMAVYAGIGTPKILGTDETTATATFSPSDSTTAEADVSSTQNVKFSTTDDITDEKFATQTMTVSFYGITFPEPGIYRYKITETENNTASIASDPAAVRYLDVYVESDGAGATSISGYVLHNEATTVTMDGSTSGSSGSYADVKSQGYTNTYTSYDLTISNTVSGNQSSQDKYFQYTVTLTGLGKNGVVTVDLGNAEANPAATASSVYSSISNASSITADDNGNATATFYLRSGQSLKLCGIAKSAAYTVTETEEDYTAAKAVTGANDTATTADSVSEAAIDSDDTIAFTNSRQGAVPTGVIFSMVPYLVGGAAAIGGVTITAAVKRKKNGDKE